MVFSIFKSYSIYVQVIIITEIFSACVGRDVTCSIPAPLKRIMWSRANVTTDRCEKQGGSETHFLVLTFTITHKQIFVLILDGILICRLLRH